MLFRSRHSQLRSQFRQTCGRRERSICLLSRPTGRLIQRTSDPSTSWLAPAVNAEKEWCQTCDDGYANRSNLCCTSGNSVARCEFIPDLDSLSSMEAPSSAFLELQASGKKHDGRSNSLCSNSLWNESSRCFSCHIRPQLVENTESLGLCLVRVHGSLIDLKQRD